MATAFATQLTTIRDALAAELAGETARRAALVAAGNPPPTMYTSGGKTTDWNGYMTMMLSQIAQLNRDVIAAGGDGGLVEQSYTAYSG